MSIPTASPQQVLYLVVVNANQVHSLKYQIVRLTELRAVDLETIAQLRSDLEAANKRATMHEDASRQGGIIIQQRDAEIAGMKIALEKQKSTNLQIARLVQQHTNPK